jgi:hypothetical protein
LENKIHHRNLEKENFMPCKDPEKRRAYQSLYKRRWYQENKAKHISYVRKREVEMETWFRGYKETLSCEICSENHPACLDFHHINPSRKKFSVSAKRDRPSLKQLQQEIAKCQVLCANCHRKEHYKQREKQRDNLRNS